jgi:hypothetical protein
MHLGLALLLVTIAASADRPRLPPVDQCAASPGFSAYRAELDDAVARQDVSKLLSLTDPDVLLSFGEEKGHADLRRIWALDQPEKSGVWKELAEVLRLGCVLDGGTAIAPSLAHDIPDGYEIYDVLVAVRPGSPLRASADDTAAAVAKLDWDLLEVESWDETTNWVKVRLKDGRAGFVRAAEVRSPIDYRATFENKGGSWRMTIFIAGD